MYYALVSRMRIRKALTRLRAWDFALRLQRTDQVFSPQNTYQDRHKNASLRGSDKIIILATVASYIIYSTVDPDHNLRSVTSDLGLHWLSMSHRKDSIIRLYSSFIVNNDKLLIFKIS